MKLSRRWYIHWYWSKYEWFAWGIIRFNSGGYGWGASPYTYWRVGPILVKRYM